MGDPAVLQAIMNVRKEPGLRKQSTLVKQHSFGKMEPLLKSLSPKLIRTLTPNAIEGCLALFQQPPLFDLKLAVESDSSDSGDSSDEYFDIMDTKETICLTAIVEMCDVYECSPALDITKEPEDE